MNSWSGKQRLRTGAGLLFAALLAAATACQMPRDPDTLIVNIATEPPTLDPAKATDHVSFNVIANLMSGLVEYDRDYRPVPGMAERWEVLDGGHRYVFHLREGLEWSDGKPLTAHDYEFAWKRLIDPETASDYSYLLYDVENAKAINQKEIADLDRLGVKALDDRTFEVKLSNPVAYFLSICAFEITYPVRRDVVSQPGWTEAGRYVSSGPYVLKEWRHDSHIVLEANPRYYRGLAPTKRVRMIMVNDPTAGLALFDRGMLDIIDNYSLAGIDVKEMSRHPSYRRTPQLRGYYYGFNTERPPVNDVRVRRAIGHAIDRTAFDKVLLSGERGGTSWIPPGMFAHNPDAGLRFDPELARKLLAEAGYPGGKGFPRIELHFNQADIHLLVAQIVQSLLKRELNIDVELRTVEWKVYLTELREDPPHLYRMGWGADYPDPDNFLNLFTGASGNNFTRWSSAEYDALVTKASMNPDPDSRRADYDRLQEMLLVDTAAIVPLFFTSENTVYAPGVSGFEYDGFARLRLFPVAFTPQGGRR